MRLLVFCSLATLATASQAGGLPARNPAPAATAGFKTSIWIHRIDENAPDGAIQDYRGEGYRWYGEDGSWITPEDVPPEFRRRPFKNVSAIVVDVDTSGKPAGCRTLRASPEPRLDALACALLMKRSSYRVRYTGPGQPEPYRFAATVIWRTDPARPGDSPPPLLTAPPAPEGSIPDPAPSGSMGRYGGWPRLNWVYPDTTIMRIVPGPAPAIQAAWPRGAQGTVSLDLDLSPEKGVTKCRVGVSSGSAALDEAACRVAATVPVRYERPCEGCREQVLPLQVVWKKKGSHIRLPLPPGAPTYIDNRHQIGGRITAADFAHLPDRTIKKRLVSALLWVDREGRPYRCGYMARSTGNAAVDARLCALMVERMRYSVRTDVFGDPAPDLFYAQIDLTGVL